MDEQISHYRILKKLGSGGMGEVYLAEDTSLGRTVAIKILPSEVANDAERLRRFVQEARAASAIKHPNVASIYELGEASGRHYIAMEHVEGETLDHHIRHPLAVNEILDIAIQAADALDDAHCKGIIHRDLKPANVMLTPRGQVKVLDFGLAKMTEQFHESSSASKLETRTETEPGLVMGTVQYMSPEQALGKTVDQRSDIFSLGVMLYQMATGRVPFSGASVTDTINLIVNSNPEAIARLNYNIPVELEYIVRKCLEKDPDRRYQTTHDLWIDLKNLKRDTDSGTSVSQSKVTPAESKSRWPYLYIGIAAVVLLALIGLILYRQKPVSKPAITTVPETTSKRKMIAVMPFENLGSADDQYFAAGITEEITSRLAAVQDLGVISRTSAMQYEKSGKTIKQIGHELGVDYVLEGSVRWDRSQKETSRVRITPQLIRVSDDTHLWSEIYDRVLDDVFKVQSDIAQSVIDQLDVRLLATAKKAMSSAAPTTNMEAYQQYLRAAELFHYPGYDKQVFGQMLSYLDEAIKLDPNFAVALAWRTRIHLQLYHEGFDATPERLAKAKQDIDQALALQPDLPIAQVALGFYRYHGLNDYDGALEAFNKAISTMPNDPEALSAIGYVERRQGKFEDSIQHLQKAFELDPRSSDYPQEIASILMRMRRYADADQQIDISLSISKQKDYGYFLKWANALLWKGSPDAGRSVLTKIPAGLIDTGGLLSRQDAYERNYASALRGVSALKAEVFQEEALFLPKDLLLGQLLSDAHQTDLARQHFERARGFLESEMEKRPRDIAVRLSLANTYARLGMKEKALQTASLDDTAKNQLSKDRFMGPNYYSDQAEVFMLCGQQDRAIDLLDRLLSAPSLLSVPMLRFDPTWDGLRNNPRFAQMLARHQS
jgi:serine/threonine protein kinase/tetratricopeptide (TPR) repeat protein